MPPLNPDDGTERDNHGGYVPHASGARRAVLGSNAVGSNTAVAKSMINYYYYGLNISTPGYIGGYFWWYYYEDMLPYTKKPLWQTLDAAFSSMPVTPFNGGRGRP